MKLNQLNALLDANRDKRFLLQLPDQKNVPVSFHVTEVGHVNKKFIDCGGALHTTQSCQLQVWVGEDVDHRLNAGKLADILKLARAVVPSDALDVEIEYEDTILSQYPISNFQVTSDAVVLQLTTKHTDCLAKDKCVTPAASGPSCCGPAGCC
jgi:hypothetical protein